MILTVTMNPSIDISYPLETFELDTVNRVSQTLKTPGGKGLNVTRVLAQLNDKVCASGLLGGKLGAFLQEELDKAGIEHDFYRIAGETRNCIAILHQGQQTEILEEGPTISEEEAAGFLAHFERQLPSADAVTVSGSLPKGIPAAYYAEVTALCQKYQVPMVLDCSGQALLAVLQSQHRPTVIKPNTEELSQLLCQEVTADTAVLKKALSKELFADIDWVIVSLGAEGAFAKHGSKFYKVSIPKIAVVNPVGSGDSTVAGIASALVSQASDEDLLRKANTMGMLNAQEKLTGHVNMANYHTLFKQIQIVEV